MEEMGEMTATDLQAARLHQMADSLSSKRTEDESDVCLVCQDKEFFAHKLILQTASPYFATMFTSQMKEKKSGRVTFSEMESQTLEAVLDFIYLGKVENVKTEDQYKKLLKVSHLMQLDTLYHYCCSSLGDRLSSKNYFEYFHLSKKYDSRILRTKLYAFWTANCNMLLSTDEFLRLSVLEVKALVEYLKCKEVCLDSVVGGIIKWLYHDLEDREKFAGELLKCADGQLLSKEFVKSLFQKLDTVESSQIITNELKELTLITLTSNKRGRSLTKKHPNCQSIDEEMTFQSWVAVLLYLSGECIIDVFDPTSTTNDVPLVVERTSRRNCVQQFDICTMTWLPVHYPNCDGNQNLNYYHNYNNCRSNRYIYLFPMFNFAQTKNCCYDLLTNTVVSNGLPEVKAETGYSICYFKEYFYTFGAKKATASVNRVLPGESKWVKVGSLPLAQSFPTVLTSSEYIYIIGDNPESKDEIAIQCSSNPAKDGQWQVICVRRQGLHPKHFFLSQNTLNALYFGEGESKYLVYDHATERLTVKRKFEWPDSEPSSLKLSKFQNPQCPVVFFSQPNDYFSIPSFLWDPETGMWSRLPPQQGKCRIVKSHDLEMFYFFEK